MNRERELYAALDILHPVLRDLSAAEGARDRVQADHLDALLDLYRCLPSEHELRGGIFDALQDHLLDAPLMDDPRRLVLLYDALSVEDPGPSSFEHARMATALCVAAEDFNTFTHFYQSVEIATQAAAKELGPLREQLEAAALGPPPADAQEAMRAFLAVG